MSQPTQSMSKTTQSMSKTTQTKSISKLTQSNMKNKSKVLKQQPTVGKNPSNKVLKHTTEAIDPSDLDKQDVHQDNVIPVGSGKKQPGSRNKVNKAVLKKIEAPFKAPAKKDMRVCVRILNRMDNSIKVMLNEISRLKLTLDDNFETLTNSHSRIYLQELDSLSKEGELLNLEQTYQRLDIASNKITNYITKLKSELDKPRRSSSKKPNDDEPIAESSENATDDEQNGEHSDGV